MHVELNVLQLGASPKEQVFHFELPGGRLSSLVMLQLQTGRQHQIRAHLSGCGHPLLGDVDYGASVACESCVKPCQAKAWFSLGGIK